MKLSSRIHGIVDYLVVLFLWLSPTLFDLPPQTALYTYILGGIHLTLTITTNFEVGVFKIIPLRIHGTIELLVSILLVGFAFVLEAWEGPLARNFYLIFGIAVFLTWLVSDYQRSAQD